RRLDYLQSFFFVCYDDHLDLHSFPTRRSSDLLKPEVVYKGKHYRSTNVLGTADSWRSADRGTNGKWYPPEKLKNFTLTITYRDGLLSTYINNLLDQSVEIKNLHL